MSKHKIFGLTTLLALGTLSATAAAQATDPAPPTSRDTDSVSADDGTRTRTSLLPIDDANRARWYRPEEGEGRPPARLEYWPGAVLLEPQFLTGGARGGVVTTLRLNLPFGPGAGASLGAQLADSPRFIGGFDFFRYLGMEFPLARMEAIGSFSAVLAPTIGIEGFVNGSAVGGDFSLQPVGVRALLTGIRGMVELRVAGHFLVGGEIDSFGGGGDALARPSTGGAIGLQLAMVPLLIKGAVTGEPRQEPTGLRSPIRRPSRPADELDDDDDRPQKRRRRPDDEETRLAPEVKPRAAAFAEQAVTGGAR